MTPNSENTDRPALPAPATNRIWRRPATAATLAAFLVVGAAAGAGAMRIADRAHPQAVMLLQPTAINALRANAPAAIKGKVADVFGNTFIVDDGSGRMLVDTGPRGEGQKIVTPDEVVTVQGRFDGSQLRAQVLSHADGRSEGFGPPKPPLDPRGPGGAPPPPPAGPASGAPAPR